jgi:Short C-terminal domain
VGRDRQPAAGSGAPIDDETLISPSPPLQGVNLSLLPVVGHARGSAKLTAMECVCGCGKEIPGKGKPADRNFAAARVALELLVWDKNRASPAPGPDGREGLIARGADCYQRLLDANHEEGADDPDDDCDAWLRQSTEMRAGQPEMNKFAMFGNSAPSLGKSDMAHLDRKHPELSFTGRLTTEPPPTPAPTEAPADLVEKLERLRTLRDDGALTDEEFAAAKARLLGG